MNLHTKKAKLAACAVGALSAAVLAVSASPASASGTYSGRAYVYGAGDWRDDWGDEGVVDYNTNKYSNATCLWQRVLWADGELVGPNDGIFGSQTKAATASWQADHGLFADGSAGKNTWTKANAQVDFYSGSTASGQSLTLIYNGAVRNFLMVRDTNGNYQFWDEGGVKRAAGYDYRTCS
ncbi:peptidoglycan-binding protein [Streptomyces sp. NPDC050743]|uniref:peptidoglycan-binding protein n=1 Tax=Streptomyces sp. NPDC050743 TaxID=3365634 RepID=UPI0037AB081F